MDHPRASGMGGAQPNVSALASFFTAPGGHAASKFDQQTCRQFEDDDAAPFALDDAPALATTSLRRFSVNGTITFTVVSLHGTAVNARSGRGAPGRRLAQPPESFSRLLVRFVESFARAVPGALPMVVCSDENTQRTAGQLLDSAQNAANKKHQRVLRASLVRHALGWPGMPQPFRRVARKDECGRGSFGPCDRNLDPSVNLKYLYAYWVVRRGYRAFFLDADTEVHRPPAAYFGAQLRLRARGAASVYELHDTEPQHMPDLLAQLDMW